jgi:ribose 5-phosphate isomerase A
VAEKSTDPHAAAKEAAGRRAAEEVRDGMRVGLGTGSTVHFLLVAVSERSPDVTCVATSKATEDLATELGIRIVPPGAVDGLDLAIDGADQVDPDFNLVKGAGGAQTREKIVATMADRFVVIVDEAKVVKRIAGVIPLEVIEFAIDIVPRALSELGATHVRQRQKPSDNGNPLLDASFDDIEDPIELAMALDAIPGIIEHGIFPAGMVDRVVVGAADPKAKDDDEDAKGVVRDLSRD